jgi:hypothetical protein
MKNSDINWELVERLRFGEALNSEDAGYLASLIDMLSVKLEQPGTPAATWREKGEADPHGTDYDRKRAALTLGKLTDDELANGVFMNGDQKMDMRRLLGGDPGYHPPIVWLTAAKERIRWLSRALVKAAADSQPFVTFDDGSKVFIDSWTGGAHATGHFGGITLRFVDAAGAATVRGYQALDTLGAKGEKEWVTKLRSELMMSKMTHNFTLSRDEVIELLGGRFMAFDRASQLPQPDPFRTTVAQTLRSIGVPGMMISGEASLEKLRELLETAEKGSDPEDSPLRTAAHALVDRLPKGLNVHTYHLRDELLAVRAALGDEE